MSDLDQHWASATGADGHLVEPEADEYDEMGVLDREQADMVAKTREEMGGEAPDAEWALREKFPIVDWAAAYETDFSKVDWLPGKFLERGQQVSLVGDGKAGKSLFVLDWVWHCVMGRGFLDDYAKYRPLRVLYLDKENSLRDLITRARSLGASPGDLEDLIYMQFPKFSGSLDAQPGRAAGELMELVDHFEADIVVLDTVSRFVGGKENDSDTWLSLYRLVHEQLKKHGVACVRLDHFGKDDTKGSRGSSAKTQDVDHVWELSKTNETEADDDGLRLVTTGLKLHRTHTRTGLGRGSFQLTRVGKKFLDGGWVEGQTYHDVADAATAAKREQDENAVAMRLVADVLRAGFKGPVTQRSLGEFLKQKRMTGLKSTLMAKVREQLQFELKRAIPE